MQTIALVTLTPSNVNLDGAYAPTQGAGGNGWVPIFEASAWSFELTWNAGDPTGLGPNGAFYIQGTSDAVAKPLNAAVNAVADANLTIFTMYDDFNVEMVKPAGGVAGTWLFTKARPSPARWIRLNYLGGAAGCLAQLTKVVFHASGLRDA